MMAGPEWQWRGYLYLRRTGGLADAGKLFGRRAFWALLAACLAASGCENIDGTPGSVAISEPSCVLICVMATREGME